MVELCATVKLISRSHNYMCSNAWADLCAHITSLGLVWNIYLSGLQPSYVQLLHSSAPIWISYGYIMAQSPTNVVHIGTSIHW